MTSDILQQIQAGLDEVTPARRAMIHRAYALLPRIEDPRILDIGCGRGGPTLELAALSGGHVTGVDIDEPALRELEARAAELNLSHRVSVRRCSMASMDFADASFDVLWTEGALRAMDYEEALAAWRRLLPAGGSLVVHEMAWLRPDPPDEIVARWTREFPGIRTAEAYLAAVGPLGYRPVGGFALPVDFWWEHYYGPLAARIEALRETYANDRAALAVLNAQEREVELYQRNQAWYGSAYAVMTRV